jgi:hypothetical protein
MESSTSQCQRGNRPVTFPGGEIAQDFAGGEATLSGREGRHRQGQKVWRGGEGSLGGGIVASGGTKSAST